MGYRTIPSMDNNTANELEREILLAYAIDRPSRMVRRELMSKGYSPVDIDAVMHSMFNLRLVVQTNAKGTSGYVGRISKKGRTFLSAYHGIVLEDDKQTA